MLPGGIGFTELLVVGIVAVLLFGSKLPEVAKNFGRSYQQFRKGLSDFQSSFKVDMNDTSTINSPRIQHRADSERSETETPRFVAPPPSDVQEPDKNQDPQ